MCASAAATLSDAAGDAGDAFALSRGLQSVKDDVKDKNGELAKLMESKQYKPEELCLFKLILEELCTVGGKGKNGL